MISSGCAKISHLDQLLTMKSLSDDQTQQQKYVKDRYKKFKALLAAVESGNIKNYPDKKKFLKTFGEPIYTETIDRDKEKLEQLMYRYSTQLSGSEKVYVFFNTEGKLTDWKYFPPTPTKAESK